MSLNIQTANGLLEIGGNVTEEKIISALGYEPADKKDLPNITEDESGELNIADQSGNVIVKVGADGLYTTEVIANGIEVGKTVVEHTSNSSIHVTSAEKQAWNNKSDFSGSYADLIDAPNITENESGNMIITDENSNIIMQVDANGLETTTVTAKSAVINGIDITVKFDEHKEDINEVDKNLSSHASDTAVHVSGDDRTLWNNKSDFSGDYEDLTNAPNIKEDNSSEVVYADETGNIVVRIGESGLETTNVISNTVVANGVDVGAKLNALDSALSAHANETDGRVSKLHITDVERAAWNAKSDFDGDYNSLTNKPSDLASTIYVDEKLAELVNSAPDKLNTLDELAAALGDDENFAVTVTNALAEKAKQTDFDLHTSNTTSHITAIERTKWNEKSNFSGDYNDLTNAPDIKEDNTGNLVIADNNGNIIFRSDGNGFETTTLTAKTVTVNDMDVETSIVELQDAVAGKAASSHNHTITASASDDDVVVLTGTNGTNKVTYSASHATSGVTAGAYKSVTVNKYGHVTAGTNPTTLSGYGITDAASKTHSHAISDITNLQTTLDGKASTSSLSNYYTKAEIDSLVLITVDDIDSICG